MNLFKPFVLASSLLPLLLSGENVPVGIRLQNKPVQEQIPEKTKEIVDLPEKTKEIVDLPDETKKIIDSPDEIGEINSDVTGFLFDRYPPVFYSAAHHAVAEIGILPNDQYTLKLEDGSEWKISSYDGLKILSWRIDEPLMVTQNNRWFSQHNYRLINRTNGVSVEATLFMGPIVNGKYSRFITQINHDKKEVRLNDYTQWTAFYSDSHIFSTWAVGDYVIIGINSNTSFWDSSADTMLINVNMNNCVRTKQF